ncbi:MAG TPA: hypothetical protein VH538_07825 [Gaiellaceae bacterium]|jgi:hypothetical protein
MRSQTLLLCAAAAAATFATASLAASPVETVVLEPIASSVKGTATVGVAGTGTTARARFALTGVRPGALVRAVVQAGSCKRPSASLAAAGAARATAAGKARWSARVSIAGRLVSWIAIADGDHVVTVISDGHAAACAAIPGMS